MDLLRDVLDKHVVDRRGRKLGRVDGVVLELRPGRPPRVAGIEIGAATLARRIHPRLERVVRAIMRRWGPEYASPVRIAIEQAHPINDKIRLDLDEVPELERWEHWWREHVVERLPGAKS